MQTPKNQIKIKLERNPIDNHHHNDSMDTDNDITMKRESSIPTLGAPPTLPSLNAKFTLKMEKVTPSHPSSSYTNTNNLANNLDTMHLDSSSEIHSNQANHSQLQHVKKGNNRDKHQSLLNLHELFMDQTISKPIRSNTQCASSNSSLSSTPSLSPTSPTMTRIKTISMKKNKIQSLSFPRKYSKKQYGSPPVQSHNYHRKEWIDTIRNYLLVKYLNYFYFYITSNL